LKKAVLTLILLAAVAGALLLFVSKVRRLVPPAKMPPATQILMEKLGQADRDLLHALYLVTNRTTGAAASGLLTSDGIIVTDGHSIEGLRLQDLAVTSSTGDAVPLKGMEVDRALDLGFLFPAKTTSGGLELGEGGDFGPGDQIYAWGFSDAFVPPMPLLCMGYVAGFHLAPGESEKGASTKLVIGGTFAASYGGAPLFRWRDNQMVGLLVMRTGERSTVVEAVPVKTLRERVESMR
jgi:hypothetical protein